MAKDTMHTDLSKWIKLLRAQSELSIEDAASRLQIDAQKLVRMEQGVPIPMFVLAKMPDVYGISPEEMISKIMSLQRPYFSR